MVVPPLARRVGEERCRPVKLALRPGELALRQVEAAWVHRLAGSLREGWDRRRARVRQRAREA